MGGAVGFDNGWEDWAILPSGIDQPMQMRRAWDAVEIDSRSVARLSNAHPSHDTTLISMEIRRRVCRRGVLGSAARRWTRCKGLVQIHGTECDGSRRACVHEETPRSRAVRGDGEG